MEFVPVSMSSVDLEATVSTKPSKRESWRAVLMLAYQSIGIVYGDLGTSPLYLFRSTFSDDMKLSDSTEGIFGVLSCVFWTLTLIALVKYVILVLWADDNGEGGPFALYSLLCRHARIGFLPSGQLADEELSMYKKRDNSSRRVPTDLVKGVLEKNKVLQHLLLLLAMLGSCVVVVNGVLTPAISVLSAVSGFEFALSRHNHQYVEVPAACVLLVCLFVLQHYGTHRVGFLFAPIIITWLLCISIIGLYNIFYWNPRVYQALSPHYMYKFIKKAGKAGWQSLAGILLCVAGSEIVFVDLGHFSLLSLRIAFICFVYPLLILSYMGQAAFFSKHQFTENQYQIGFFVTVPDPIKWPVIAIAVVAAVVGSQAVITGSFSIIKQCSALSCFPRVKVIHTSPSVHGQIYIPEINWILMTLGLAVTIGFRDTLHLANASGLAVITGMLVTTCLMAVVTTLCWHRNVLHAICFLLFFGTIEAVYFSASLMYFCRGGWFSVVLVFILMTIMCVWRYGTVKRYEFDVQNKVSVDWLVSLAPTLGVVRVRGIGLIHTELVSGVPAIFAHFVTNLPAFHQVLVFLCIKSVQVPYVKPEERFLVGRIGAKEYNIYRCIVRYGYRDVHRDDMDFEKELISRLAEFIRAGGSELNKRAEFCDSGDERMAVVGRTVQLFQEDTDPKQSPDPSNKRVRFVLPESQKIDSTVRAELHKLTEAREAGMAFILPNCYVRAKASSGWLKKLAVDYCYDFLRRNCRSVAQEVTISRVSTLEVAMIYHV